jgi:hypothetical protein
MRKLVALLTLLGLAALAPPAFAKGEKAQPNVHLGENLGVQIDGVVRRGKRVEVKGHVWLPGGHPLQLEGKEVRRFQVQGTSMIVSKPRLLRTLLHAERGDKAVKAAGLKFTATVDPKTGLIDLGRMNGQRVKIKLSGQNMESVHVSSESSDR